MNDEQTLDLLASKEEQLKVLVPYLANAAKNEDKKPLLVTNRSLVLGSRILVGWKEYLLPKETAVTEEGAFYFYLRLERSGNER